MDVVTPGVSSLQEDLRRRDSLVTVLQFCQEAVVQPITSFRSLLRDQMDESVLQSLAAPTLLEDC